MHPIINLSWRPPAQFFFFFFCGMTLYFNIQTLVSLAETTRAGHRREKLGRNSCHCQPVSFPSILINNSCLWKGAPPKMVILFFFFFKRRGANAFPGASDASADPRRAEVSARSATGAESQSHAAHSNERGPRCCVNRQPPNPHPSGPDRPPHPHPP